MKICELKVQHDGDRATLVSILAFAGYKVSIDARKPKDYLNLGKDYFVIVEDKEDNDEN